MPTHPFSPAAEKSKRVCGTGNGGWVIISTDDAGGQEISLFNHFTGSEISLPSLITTANNINELIHSSSSSSSSSSSNKNLHVDRPVSTLSTFVEDCSFSIRLPCRSSNSSPAPDPKRFHSSNRYPLESIHGELFQVVWCPRLSDSYSEVGIEVFRIRGHGGAYRSEDDKGWWVRVTHLVDQIFLLGYYASFALSSSHFTTLAACKANWIYHNGGFCYPNSHIFIYISYRKF
ncbi:hypothetical protein H6P81_008423 [Aristolochia fimbriata]|uniref:KIB1-4 beta-propeller domain-containing protein n=1 Tax=Aristolochia fimbriata TaxID=158543 RepID=A0AAV7EMJ1_ARIFI|nr:hypothetical protein H6P81_008423 [Aristolochia fimbriata]